MFIGREKELNILEKYYHSNKLKVITVEGAHKIGKTELIKIFLKKKKSMYFFVRNNIPAFNKNYFIYESFEQGMADADNWEDCLRQIIMKAINEKIVLVIDNADYLTNCFDEMIVKINEIIQSNSNRLRLMIILISVYKLNEVIKKLEDFNGLSIECIELKPLKFIETYTFFEGYDNEEKVLLYGITGGLPGYIKSIDPNLSARDNVLNLFFKEDSYMIDEVTKNLSTKFRELSTYNSILYSMACGDSRLSEIAKRIDMECNKLSKYIKILFDLKIIDRVISDADYDIKMQHKKTYYIISNTMLKFWFKYVFPYQSLIKIGKGGNIFRSKIVANLGLFCEDVFKVICIQHCYILKDRSDFAINFKTVRHYWDSTVNKNDLIFVARENANICVIFILWKKYKIDIKFLEKFISLNLNFMSKNITYLLFSRKGFTDRMLQYSAANNNVRLISLQYLK